MRINLIPRELQPTRPSPVPYMFLGGLVAISAIWSLTQLAAMSAAQNETEDFTGQHRKLRRQLSVYKELPGRLAHAESERDLLKLKAAAVTALIHSGFTCSNILQAVAETTPAELRLTGFSLDVAKGTATLIGYGSEEKADIDVAAFLRALNMNKGILAAFSSVRLDYCNSAKQGEIAVKRFSISMGFREDKLKQLIREATGSGGEEGNG